MFNEWRKSLLVVFRYRFYEVQARSHYHEIRESLRIQMSFQNGAENADERQRNLKNGHESLVSSHGFIKVELPP